ncbi:TetR/AcrR family transcriptional regulator [Nocardia goodfellowii]|uniref:AcrR family transcriptional regulator n=1 Tax=Nocardia goodfellowii TaxID=882446 RepID=A0ABS4QIC6_9NOCA|nr:TetR family transcriptional regulator [Nocardia goodfellowii]MBP2191442.1 AcrR family transcriptional regulator [Nocardia goodfellowii]
MRTRNPEAKRQQLFDAALAEFAEFGLAGARIDRLAKRAEVSAGLVYSFYKGKDELFDAVFDMIVDTTVATVPLDADRLPEYAAQLYDAGQAHPEVMRFLMWYHLLRGESAQRASVAESMRAKVEAIEQAQHRGTVTTAQPATHILALVLTVANMWHQPAEDIVRLVPEPQRRKLVLDAVTALIAPTDT